MMDIPQHQQIKYEVESDEWTLSPQQMLFLMQNHNALEKAYADGDLDFLRQFAESKAFKDLFGNMSFDEAYDRYETTLEAGDAT
jgi:hypothetical protein